MVIAIAGASGDLGRRTAERAIERVEPEELILSPPLPVATVRRTAPS
jgi:hypothetical protein